MDYQLSKEQTYFINLIRDYLKGMSSGAIDSPDWQQIKNYADLHCLAAVLYYQTRQPLFQKDYAFQIFQYANFKHTIEALKAALRGYRFFIVKGTVVADLYPVPALRSMGDVDVIIHIEDRDEVHKALENAGFRLQHKAIGEWKYSKDGCFIEVHDSLVHRKDELKDLTEYYSGVWDYVVDGQLDWSYHLVFEIEHLRQHFFCGGAGFRQFMDIAIIARKCEINWSFVETELTKIKLYDFALVIFAFIKEWFDIAVPMETRQLSDDFYIEATNRIFENGVFGFNIEDNKITDVAAWAVLRESRQQEAAKKYVWNRFFPSYEYMCGLPDLAYVRKSRLLLPAAWIHRLVIRSVNKESREKMKTQLSDDKTEKRIEMLKEWGL